MWYEIAVDLADPSGDNETLLVAVAIIHARQLKELKRAASSGGL